MPDSGPHSLEAADAQRRHALRKAESCARALVSELTSLQEYYGRLNHLRSDMRETEAQVRSARFSIGQLSTELQHSLREFAAADTIQPGSPGDPEEAEP